MPSAKLFSTLVTSVVGVLIAVTAGSPAVAATGDATPPPNPEQHLSATYSSTSAANKTAAPNAGTVITCTMKVDDVHPSTTEKYKGNPNVHAKINCNAAMDTLYLTVMLYKESCNGTSCHDVAVGDSHPKTLHIANYIDTNSALGGCIAGSYYGTATGYATAPAEYSPRTQSFSGAGTLWHAIC